MKLLTRFFVIVGVETFSTTRQLRWTKLLPFVTNRKPFKGSFYVFVTFDHLAKSTKKGMCAGGDRIYYWVHFPKEGHPSCRTMGAKASKPVLMISH